MLISLSLSCLVICTCFIFSGSTAHRHPPSFPTRRSSDLDCPGKSGPWPPRESACEARARRACAGLRAECRARGPSHARSEEHTSELQSRLHLVCRLLLEKKKETDQTKKEEHHT